MNIRISIKDSDQPAVLTKNTLSQVEHKKKNMLYSPPQKDHSKTKSTLNAKTNQKNQVHQTKQPSLISTENQRKMMEQLDAASKNQVSLDMVNNSNRILQRQNQILEDNQRTLHQIVKKKSESSNGGQREESTRNAMVQALEKVTRDVQQMQRIRNQIVKVGQDVRKTFDQMKAGGQGLPRMPQEISQMNNNLRNLTQASQNHLQGLQNLQALKNLQNFNVNAYVQSVDKLKRQIIQYQKQSQAIQKQLRTRAAKLEKLQIPKNFDDQLIEPYHKYLQGKTKNVNLHAIREEVYERIGLFDYGRFESDISDIMNEVKGCMGDFKITCKQYEIDVPTMKIDQKQIKSLNLQMPSILDDYKASRGINFKENAARQNNKLHSSQGTQEKPAKKDSSLGKNTKNDRNKLKNMITKPIDMATNVKYTRKDKQQNQTILRTDQQKQKRDLQERMKKPAKNKEQDQFGKYLQNRAREQLESLYQQKRDQLRKMQKDLYQQYQQPVHITLNLDQKRKFERQAKPQRQIMQQKRRSAQKEKKKMQQQQQSNEQQYGDDFQDQSNKNSPKKQKPNEHGFKRDSRDKSKQALKDRLKQLLNKEDKSIPRPNQVIEREGNNNIAQPNNYGMANGNSALGNVGNLAEGLVALINNTLTQVNANLSKNIEKRISSRQRPNQQARNHSKSPPRRINVPKLQEFRPPPVFNMNMNTNSINNMHIVQTRKQPVVQQKIIAKNYDHLKVEEDNQDLYVSDFSKDDDY